MKRLILLLTVLLPGILMNSQKVESTWSATPLLMDGSSADWDGMLKEYNSKAKMFYEVLNDDEYLFLRFQISDETAKNQFMMAGFEIDFSDKGRPKLKASIKFPAMERSNDKQREGSREDMRSNNSQQRGGQGQEKPDILNKYILQASFAGIEGFKRQQGLIQNKQNPDTPFTYGLKGDKNKNIILEIRIPFTELFEEGQSMDQMAKSKLKITPKLLALKQSSMGQGQGQQGGMASRGGMGGGMGSGMGGGMGGPGMGSGGGPGGGMRQGGSSQQSTSSQQSFTLKVKLTQGE